MAITAAQCISDMKSNDMTLHAANAGASWSRSAILVMGADWRGQATPTWWNSTNKFYGYWNASLPWLVVWDGSGHQAGLNTRLWLKRFRYYILNTSGVWIKGQDTAAIGGAYYRRDIVNSVTTQNIRTEAAGGISVKLAPNVDAIFHGWTTWLSMPGADVRGIQMQLDYELIKEDPNGVDDRHKAIYGVSVGGDAYVYVGQRVSDFSPAGYNAGIGGSKFKLATTAGTQTVCFTNLDSCPSIERSSVGGKQSYFVMSEAAFLANLPPDVTLAGSADTPPAPTPPPAPVGRKEIWFSGSAVGSSEDGTAANPINTLATLRSAITTYGPTGIDLRKTANGVWTGVFPQEAFQYPGTTIKGNDWLADTGHFEGGVRKTDWTTEAGAPGGKQLWKCTSMTSQSATTSDLQPGAVSIDDAVIASRLFTNLADTITAMDDFDQAYSYDSTNNVVYVLLPTGENPNTLVTMVSQTAHCMGNGAFAALGNKRTGIVLENLRFKRYSGFPVSLANLTDVQIRKLYFKHIGGRYRPTPEGKGLVLYGCDGYIVEDIRGDGVEQGVFGPELRDGFPTQSNGVARRITGSHIGIATVMVRPFLKDGGVMDGMTFEDITGTDIGGFSDASRRPDIGGVGLISVTAPMGPGTTSVNNLVVRRAVASDVPVGKVDLGYTTTGRSVFFEACQGKADETLALEYGIGFGHEASGSGSDSFNFRACAFEGYKRGVSNLGGQHSFAVSAINCGFDNLSVAALDMNGVANTVLTIQNNVAHDSVLLVKSINGAGSSAVNEGGNYVSTGTSLGVTAVGTDDTAAADPGFVGVSVAKPPSGSALYSGGTALTITNLKDRLLQTFESPWAQGPYAQYSASEGVVVDSPPVPGGSSGLSVWEDKYIGGALAFLAEQAGSSSITGITGVPTTRSLIIGESYQLSPTVTGTGEYSSAVTYSVVTGSSATVVSTGLVKAIAVGVSRIRVASTQVPTVFVDILVTVSNFSEHPISASPTSISLNLIDGAGEVTIYANGKTQAGLSALSTNSLVAVAASKTGFGGKLEITPVAVGTCTVLVTKASRFGGQMTIEIPVTVTEGTVAGDVTAITTDGDSVDENGNHTIEIDDTPYFIALKDQNGDPITGFDHVVKVDVSTPGYIRAPHTVIDGTLPVYPQGVGIATVTLELHDETAGRVTKTCTVEVIAVGGSPAPVPPPPPPPSPVDPDLDDVVGDFIFEVKADE
jgi:hypothetical protein